MINPCDGYFLSSFNQPFNNIAANLRAVSMYQHSMQLIVRLMGPDPLHVMIR